MTVQSKMTNAAVLCTCQQFQHPWTDKCVNASVGLLFASTPYCLRVYSMVYLLSMIMRHKIPTLKDLRKMVMGILQSTAFLVTNAYTFIMFNCLLRNMLGRYYFSTVAFWPCFLGSFSAILVERPQRRPLLALYVANVATETLWNMAESRGWVKSIPNGQVLLFGASISILLYLYRLGLHKTSCRDSLFDILRIFVGKPEEGPMKATEVGDRTDVPQSNRSRPPVNLNTINGWVQVYSRLVEKLKGKHACCPHRSSCVHNAVMGGLKPMVGGIGLQVALKILLNVKRIAQNKMHWKKTIFNKQTLNLGLFLGSFSFLYKSVSCGLRHIFNRDDPRFAIPAGMIGSISFAYYPDVTVALYVMWKMLQVVYNLGIDKKKLPHIPGFTMFLYAFCTAVLFHAGILEARNLRQSYFKFLQDISGGRLSKFNMVPLDVYGLNSSQHKADVLKRLNIVDINPYPAFPLDKW
ncbi:transmembrane protein 135-like [Lucilia cuprina]|uniref:transmembrane protein 135-like n=1 Tax=Lucilia cuprina TaxID=7375 RepID=UPI001F0589F5|nr:transmembrane protein 135-like [Lucilia cuprina]XP_046805904.1 transmembrane protein 135-like [Lucilia cuprina]XP_046805905.1 transmembrane protein 135-like [Lucilia cuprina]